MRHQCVAFVLRYELYYEDDIYFKMSLKLSSAQRMSIYYIIYYIYIYIWNFKSLFTQEEL